MASSRALSARERLVNVMLFIVLVDGVLLFMLLLLLYNNIVDVVNQKRLGYQVYQHKSD